MHNKVIAKLLDILPPLHFEYYYVVINYNIT